MSHTRTMTEHPTIWTSKGKHRILLESTAHPTHHHRLVSPTSPLTTSKYRNTATSARSPIKHTGHVTIQHASHRFLRPAVISPEITDTILSVRNAAGPGHCIIFTQTDAHHVPIPKISDHISTQTHIAKCKTDGSPISGPIHGTVN